MVENKSYDIFICSLGTIVKLNNKYLKTNL